MSNMKCENKYHFHPIVLSETAILTVFYRLLIYRFQIESTKSFLSCPIDRLTYALLTFDTFVMKEMQTGRLIVWTPGYNFIGLKVFHANGTFLPFEFDRLLHGFCSIVRRCRVEKRTE